MLIFCVDGWGGGVAGVVVSAYCCNSELKVVSGLRSGPYHRVVSLDKKHHSTLSFSTEVYKMGALLWTTIPSGGE